MTEIGIFNEKKNVHGNRFNYVKPILQYSL